MRGLPDYGINSYIQATNMVDMSQLYQGLTGLVSIDGLGRIVWSDTFDKGLSKMKETLYGNALASVLNTRITLASGFSIKMEPGTIATNGRILRSATLAVPTDSNVGIEVAIYVDHTFGMNHLIGIDYCYSPGKSYYGQISFNTLDGNIYLYDGVTWTYIDNIPILNQESMWIPLKWIMNTKRGYFERMIIGSKGYDLRQYPAGISGQSIVSGCTFTIEGFPAESGSGYLGFYGYVILTTDEP